MLTGFKPVSTCVGKQYITREGLQCRESVGTSCSGCLSNKTFCMTDSVRYLGTYQHKKPCRNRKEGRKFLEGGCRAAEKERKNNTQKEQERKHTCCRSSRTHIDSLLVHPVNS